MKTNSFEILNTQIKYEIENRTTIDLVDEFNKIREEISIVEQDGQMFIKPLFKQFKRLSLEQAQDIKNLIKDDEIHAEYDSFFERFYNHIFNKTFHFEISKSTFEIFFKEVKIAKKSSFKEAEKFCLDFANTNSIAIDHSICDKFWILTKK